MSVWRAFNSHPKLVAAAAVMAATLYVALHLNSGWIAHDEGQLGQSAERILQGEIPHRDFDDMYTGALTFLNAAAFRWFGVDSLSLRWMLLLWYVPTIAAFYYLASRVTPPVGAAAVTLLGVMFSLPVYSAPMPSWYNLFLAIGGTAALVRYVETDHRRWVFVAGLCAGLSILFKITGLYFIAAGLLFFVYREQLLTPSQPAPDATRAGGWYAWLTTIALLAFASLGRVFLGSGPPLMNAIHFVLPLIALAAWLIYHELLFNRGPSLPRLRRMAAMAIPFGVGVGLPILGFVAFYASRGALAPLYEGVVVLPRLRDENAAFPLPGLEGLAVSLPLVALLALGLRSKENAAWARQITGLVLVALVALLAVSGTPWGFFVGLHAVRNIMPLLVALGLIMLLKSQPLQLSVEQRQCLFLVCCAAMMCSLVQYPHAYGIYFFYAAPLVLLTAVYIAANQPRPLRGALAGILIAYLAFAALRLNGHDPHANVVWLGGPRPSEPMGLPRCSLVVAADEAAVYRELVAAVQAHSAPDSFILATPDCPEVYYLADRQNPSHIMYEFFRPEWLANREQLRDLLDEHNVDAVVVSVYPGFSKPLDPTLLEEISARYDHSSSVMMTVDSQGKQVERFRVYWRG